MSSKTSKKIKSKYFENYKYCPDFYKYGRSYECILKALVEAEGPIHIDDIYKSIQKINNLKATTAFKTNIRFCLVRVDSISKKNNFYYNSNFDFEKMKVRKRKKPRIKHICDKEIEKSIIYTLKTESQLNRKKLIKLSSRRLGFKSTHENLKEKFNQMIDNNMIGKTIKENDDGTIELI